VLRSALQLRYFVSVLCLWCSCWRHRLFVLLFSYRGSYTTEIYTLSLHDALPICGLLEVAEQIGIGIAAFSPLQQGREGRDADPRSEEHTSELQSRFDLVCRLLLEKKKRNKSDFHLHTAH